LFKRLKVNNSHITSTKVSVVVV